MAISKKTEISFYKKKILGLINHLRKMNNDEINAYIDKNYNETDVFNDENIKELSRCKYFVPLEIRGKDSSFFGKEISRIPCSFYNKASHFMSDIASVIYKDDKLSKIDFICYLDKHKISEVLGNELQIFHEKCFKEAYEQKLLKYLEKVYSFKYIEYSLKKEIAKIIFIRLGNKKGIDKIVLLKWCFNSTPETIKIKYLKSLEYSNDISEREYLDFLLLCTKEDSKKVTMLYIYSYLLEKGELEKHIDLMKRTFQENISNLQSGKKYFDLLFKYVKSNEDMKTLKWMSSLYKKNNPSKDRSYRHVGENTLNEYMESLKS